jgi:uncharacterized membrane protein
MLQNIIALAVIMTLIDFVYLTSIGDFFNKNIKKIQGSPIKMKYLGAIICYPLMIFGLYYFIIKNKSNYKTKGEMIRDAAILGWIIYGVYESTNYAIIDKWNLEMVIIDGLWGGVLFGLTTYIYLLVFT